MSLGPEMSATSSRRRPVGITSIGDEDLVMLAVGAKGGYVERDGRMADPETL